MKNQSDSERHPTADTGVGRTGVGRQPYTTPRLVDYGPVAKLTRGTRSGEGEITPTGEKRKCL